MRFYERCDKTSENRLPPRSYYIPSGISTYTSLNGIWKFRYYERDFDYNGTVDKFDEISVPSCWQLKGYAAPNYANVQYPYPVDPPYVPDDNPCGVYERQFSIENLFGKVYFVFEGVSSCAQLYINGKYVGFTQGTHLQSEFDITDFVNCGENTVRAVVYKWCAGSYLEDQDFLRYNGIFRDCYILQRPKDHIVNVKLETKKADICIELDKSAKVSVFDAGDKLLAVKEDVTSGKIEIQNPVLWNAEKPYLYKVVIERGGEVIEQKVGFRTIEVSSDGALLINGVKVKLKGVNHHDTHEKNGWCQTNEELRRDLEIIKSLNMNCIRTSHYPPTPAFVDMCDEMGFYVVLECDLETHGFLPAVNDDFSGNRTDIFPCNDPMWKKEFVERMQRTAILNYNHSSIIMWSLGNESYYGPNHDAMIDWLRTLGDNRLVHYEGTTAVKDFSNVDVVSYMYPPMEDVKKYAEDENNKKPYFLCEYSHAMGNGPGDVWYYNELINSYDKLIGGCIWEWTDHVVIDQNGVKRYGGDFEGELTHDGNFCCDGMTFSDRSFKAGTYEIKASYAPIVTTLDGNILTVKNRYDFTNLSEFEIITEIKCDGKVVAEKSYNLDVLPHQSTEIAIDYTKCECTFGAYLNVKLIKGEETLAFIQHELPFVKKAKAKETLAANLTESGDSIIVSGNGFEYAFSKHFGTFTSIKIDGKENLKAPIALTVLRAPTDNDGHIKDYWLKGGAPTSDNFNRQFTKTYETTLSGNTVTVTGSLSGVSKTPFFRYNAKYTFLADGSVEVNLSGDIKQDTAYLPRLGFELVMPKSDNGAFSYFGMGPYENYCDMYHGSYMDAFSSTADNEYVPYVRPQEHGNHINVKKLSVCGMNFYSDSGFECNVSNYSTKALFDAEHTDELVSDGNLHVRIDYKVSGIGSNSCGPELAEEYQLNEKHIDFSFTMKP